MKKILYASIFIYSSIYSSQSPLERAQLAYEIPHEKSPILIKFIPKEVWAELIFARLIPKLIPKKEDVSEIKKLKLVCKYFYEVCDSKNLHRVLSPHSYVGTLLINTKKRRIEFNDHLFKTNSENEKIFLFEMAVKYEAIPLIHQTLRRGVDPNVMYGHVFRTNALCHATEHNKMLALETLLKIPQINPNQPDAFTMTPLMLAARYNHSECLLQLLEHPQIDPDLVNRDGRTALAVANHEHQVQAAAILLHDLNRRSAQNHANQGNREDENQNNESCACIPTHCTIS